MLENLDKSENNGKKIVKCICRNKKAIAHKNLQTILDDTPPQSPALVLQHSREDVAARNRRQMRRRRAILYAKIVNLEKKVKNAVKLSEKYKKRYLRLKTKNADPESPVTKINLLLKNLQVPDIVDQKLMEIDTINIDNDNHQLPLPSSSCNQDHTGMSKEIHITDLENDGPTVVSDSHQIARWRSYPD